MKEAFADIALANEELGRLLYHFNEVIPMVSKNKRNNTYICERCEREKATHDLVASDEDGAIYSYDLCDKCYEIEGEEGRRGYEDRGDPNRYQADVWK